MPYRHTIDLNLPDPAPKEGFGLPTFPDLVLPTPSLRLSLGNLSAEEGSPSEEKDLKLVGPGKL